MKSKLMITLVLVSSFILAQDAPSPRHGDKQPPKEKILERMKEKLNLSDEQTAQIKKIDESYSGEEKAIHEQMKALHEKRKALKDRKRSEIEKVLTPEQNAKLDEFKSKRKERMEKMKGKMKERIREFKDN